MSEVTEPVSRTDAARLRRLVLEHKAEEHRRSFPAALHVGWPGRPRLSRIEESSDPAGTLDHALRCDALEAVLRRGPGTAVMTWLTRPGDLTAQDVDLAWLRAVTTVNGETERTLAFVVVTRHGWCDPRSGVRRTWRRLRQR